VALDGRGRNGTYTEALLRHIDEPDCQIETMFKRVRNAVAAETLGKQTSWEHTSLSGNFFFNMSLGRVITQYDGDGLADGLFVIDDTKPSHKIIKGLKSCNWDRQNDALALLNAASVKTMAENNLFVLGRNIYQAACGSSNLAIHYVKSFLRATAGFPPGKQRAILDGMLFEVFFDPTAKIREKIKSGLFNELFDLQKHASLQESFAFIAETLVASRGDFYLIPGRDHELAVTVRARKVDSVFRVEAVYVDGANILRLVDEEYADDDDNTRIYKRTSAVDLTEQLSEELVVPARSLRITFTPTSAASSVLKFPLGYTVRKP